MVDETKLQLQGTIPISRHPDLEQAGGEDSRTTRGETS